MRSITLAVTSPVLVELSKGNLSQRQLSIRDYQELPIGAARRDTPVLVAIGGVFPLLVGDTGAIWAVHQTSQQQKADFDGLFDLLRKHPDCGITMTW